MKAGLFTLLTPANGNVHTDALLNARASPHPSPSCRLKVPRIEIYRRPLHRRSKPGKKAGSPIVRSGVIREIWFSHALKRRELSLLETHGVTLLKVRSGRTEVNRSDRFSIASASVDRKDNRSTRSMTRNALKDLLGGTRWIVSGRRDDFSFATRRLSEHKSETDFAAGVQFPKAILCR